MDNKEVIRRQYIGLYCDADWRTNNEKILEEISKLPLLTDRTRNFLEKNKGNFKDRDTLVKALCLEGFMGCDGVIMPHGGRIRTDGSIREKQWEFLKALAPLMYDGIILCAERMEDPDRIPGETSFWKKDSFYGFRIIDGKAFKLNIGIEESEAEREG